MASGDMVAGDVFGTGEVGDGAGNFEDAIVGAGAEVEISHGKFEEFDGGITEGAIGLQLARTHAGIARDGFFGEALLLTLTSLNDAFTNGGG